MNRDVLVVGGGIAGMQAALLLAEKNHRVHVMERNPAIGGFFPYLDRQFPTNSCGVCFMNPKPQAFCPIYESEFHPNISLLTSSEITDVQGEAGKFEVSYTSRARHVAPAKCDLCGKCSEVCPVEVETEFGKGLLKPRKAVYLPFAQAIPRCYVIDEAKCTRCGKCVDVCPRDAISLDEKSKDGRVNVGAMILTFGFEPFRGEIKGEYGLGRYKNVMSSIQYEQMLSFASPTGGVPRRPSDGKIPRSVAFIQCVGSRDIARGKGYCSSVCCMYATKQAIVTRERASESEAVIFYMDLRTVGKNYERYCQHARDVSRVQFLRSALSSVREYQQTKNLLIEYGLENGELQSKEFDLVVLSVGLTPPDSVKAVAGKLGLKLNEFGFCETEEFATTKTGIPGVFVAGAIREPRDIPETVVEACSATADVSQLLDCFEQRTELDTPVPGADEILRDYVPRIGVFLCDNRGQLADRLDLTAAAAAVRGLSAVDLVETIDAGSVAAAVEHIAAAVAKGDLNRVALAGYKGPELVRACAEAGILGPCSGVVEFAPIGEQCADVHVNDRDKATAKAISMIAVCAQKLILAQPLARTSRLTRGTALVVGGGVAGISCALSLADQNIGVTLVEKTDALGGNAKLAHRTVKGSDVRGMVAELVQRAEAHKGIEVLKGAELIAHQGKWGSFHSVVAVGGERREIDHGAIIIATGAREARPAEYLYGQHPAVITQRKFEDMIAMGAPEVKVLKNVVMIQCVGSRDDKRPYCSRICCEHAVKNALMLEEVNPEANVYIIYRDMRTYGFYEKYYQQARDNGNVFVRYEPTEKPRVTAHNGQVRVDFRDGAVDRQVRIDADLLVLSNGVLPDENNRQLAELVGLQVDVDGFFQEANPKSAPLDAVDRGKYFCGLCHSPIHIDTAIIQGKAAGARAAALLWSGAAEDAAALAAVDPSICAGCGSCVAVCRYGAVSLDPVRGTAQVDHALCRGCGVCAASCRSSAIEIGGYGNEQLLAELSSI